MKLELLIQYVTILALISFALSMEKSTNDFNESEIYGPLKQEQYISLNETLNIFKLKISSLDAMNESEHKFLAENTNHKDPFICKTCLWTYNHIHDIIKKLYGKIGLFELVDFICHNFSHLTKQACHGYIFDYGPVIIDSLIDHYLGGEFICTLMHLCKNEHFITINPDDYARALFEDKPINPFIPKIDKKIDNVWKVLHVSDIHTDLQYSEGSSAECSDPFCCRSNSVPKSFEVIEEQDRAGKWGHMGRCDLPLRTLENFVQEVINVIKPDFIIWTGDNPSHAEWEDNTAQEILNVTSIFTKLMMDSQIQVYPSLGNHEKFPSDQFYPFGGGKEKTGLEFFGNLWHTWLGDEAYDQFIVYGYYSKKHLDTNLRVISYNCFYCDVLNFYLLKNPTDPSNQIQWLEDTLRMSEQNKEEVYIIGHIPVGDTSLLTECSKRFIALIDRFSHIIRGQFAGHTHYDEVKVMRNYFDKEKVNSIQYINPSLTSLAYLNPSFRVFEVDPLTKFPIDYLQYRLNLEEANKGNNPPKWEAKYRATEFYQVENLTQIEKIKQYVLNIENDEDTYNQSLEAFFAGGPQHISYKEGKQMRRYLRCRFIENHFEDFFDCIDHKSWNSEDYYFKALNILTGKWYMKLPE